MSDGIRWAPAASLDDVWEGDLLDVEVDGEQVLLVHLSGGTVKAFQGMCPHQEILLADGEWNPDQATLLCGGHQWEFDLTTGHGLNPSGCRLYEFAVRVDDDRIVVGIPTDGERHHLRFAG